MVPDVAGSNPVTHLRISRVFVIQAVVQVPEKWPNCQRNISAEPLTRTGRGEPPARTTTGGSQCAIFRSPSGVRKRTAGTFSIDGKQINLGPDEEEAYRRYHAIMAERGKPAPIVVSTDANPALVAILEEFIDWCLKHREPRTVESYKERIQSFLNAPRPQDASRKRSSSLPPSAMVDAHENWNPGMKRGRISAVQRALNWAVKQGRLDKSPVAFMEKPPAGKRTNVISPELYQQILSLRKSQEFIDLITVTWETGCRPQEIWRVEARHLDGDGKRWVFPILEAKGKKKIRIVYLTDNAWKICQRLAKRHPTGKLFRNSQGRPWNRHSSSLVFGRMIKHLGKRYALVDLRHSFVQRSLKNGVDPVTLSFLMGHADTSMLAKVYAHLDQDAAHLQNALAKSNIKPESA